MREILFRGIPKSDFERYAFGNIWKDNCDGSFVYGSLVVDKDRYYICVSVMCKINCCINNGMTSMIEVIPESVSEFTGLPDKNGKKIFERDILKQYGFCYVVSFENGSFVAYETPFNESAILPRTDWGNAVVVGNIHDNTELLKGGVADA